jgi:hypothetical protein
MDEINDLSDIEDMEGLDLEDETALDPVALWFFMGSIGLLGHNLSYVYIYVCVEITSLCYPTLFIVHLLDQPLGYLVLLSLSIDSLGLPRDDLSSVYI